MVLRKELVQVHQKYASQEEALRSIAQTFVDLGVVKESFPQAIIDREAVYPPGLPASEFDIAISHCDSDHVNESAIGAVVLDEPVEFEMMGGMGDGPLSVRLIFMLAIKDPKAQVPTLQKMMAIIQNQQLSGCAKRASQQNPLLLTAGKRPVTPPAERNNAQLFHILIRYRAFLFCVERSQSAPI